MSGYRLRWTTWMMVLCTGVIFQAAAAAPDCLRPEGISPGPFTNLGTLEGFFLGEDRCLYDPASISPDRVPAFRGSRAPENGPIMFYINGANGSPKEVSRNIQELADSSQIAVVGILYYPNNSIDPLKDLLPKTSAGPATDTLQQVINTSLQQGEPVHIRAGSAGTVVVSEAIARVKRELTRHGRRPGDRDRNQPLDLMRVETHGTIARDFPDGPRYIHYVNLLDPVPNSLGINAAGAHPGAHAVLALFADRQTPNEQNLSPAGVEFLSVHGTGAYDRHRKCFDELYGIKSGSFLPARRVNLEKLNLPSAEGL